MYPHIVAGYGEGRLKFSGTGGVGTAECVIGFENGSSLDADVCASIIQGAWGAADSFYHLQCSNVALAEVETVINIGGTLSEGASTDVVTGEGDPPQVSPAVSVLVQKLTGTVGRAYKGRLYVPGATVAQLTSASDALAPEYLTEWGTAGLNFLTALSAASLNMVLLHKNLLLPPTSVTGLNVEPLLATQYRRQRKAPHH